MEKLTSISRIRAFKGKQDGETMVELTLDFESGKQGAVFCRRSNLEQTKAGLDKVLGKDGDWFIEEGGKFPSGDPKPGRATLLEI